VRGKGLMIGAELIIDPQSAKPAPALCQRVLTRAFHNGLILLSCGASTLRFIPPLLVSRDNVDEAMGMLEVSMKEALVEN
jgi:4-aminobutyrate aminotransferase